MPDLINFNGRLDLRFLKQLVITYCPLLTGGQGSRNMNAIGLWRRCTKPSVMNSNKDCAVQLVPTWNYEPPTVKAEYINGHQYSVRTDLIAQEMVQCIMERKQFVEEEMRQQGKEVPADRWNSKEIIIPLVRKKQKR